MERVEIFHATEEDILHVFNNIRKEDLNELQLSGYSEDNILDMYDVSTGLLCGKLDGEPVCIFGHTAMNNIVTFGFFSVDIDRKWWFRISKGARDYIKSHLVKYFPCRGAVYVCSRNTMHIRWLKRMGFRPNGYTFGKPDNKMVMMEIYHVQ